MEINMKDVLISIKGIQRGEDESMSDSDAIEFITHGKYSHEDGETIFSYAETKMTGMEGTTTTFHIKPDIVTLLREGKTNSEMVFQQGKKHVFLYDTEFGSMSLGISTKRLLTGMNSAGGDMRIDYTIDMDSMVVTQNSFVINVKEDNLLN